MPNFFEKFDNSPRRLAGIVLSRALSGEADLVVTFLTRELGLVAALAKNARASVRRFGGGLLYPGMSAWYFFRFKPNRDLALVERGESAAFELSSDPLVSALAAWALELVKGFEAPGNPAPETFNLLYHHLKRLAVAPPIDRAHTVRRHSLSFMFRYMELAGFAPNLGSCLLCGVEPHPGERWYWDPYAGGLFCKRCLERSISSGARQLSPSLLARFCSSDDYPADFSDEDLTAAEWFFERLAERQLGHGLRGPKAVRDFLGRQPEKY